MTNEEAKRKVRGYLTDILPSDCSDEIDEIINALEQQSCEDAVSREEVVNILKERYTHHAKEVERITGDAPYDYLTGLSDAIEDVRNLPSVTPERPKGKWIIDKGIVAVLFCSECGAGTMFKSPCCPNCGVEMSGGGEE